MRGISSIRSIDDREPAVGASRYVREGELRPGASRVEAAYAEGRDGVGRYPFQVEHAFHMLRHRMFN